MNEGVSDSEDPTACLEQAYRLADALVMLGEGRAAVDLIRREVQFARSSLPTGSATLLRLLSEYASILEGTDALAEAEFIRAEALEIVTSAQEATHEAADAFLKYGMLLVKMHNYDGAIARLKEAVRHIEELDDIGELHRQIILAQAWKARAQAYEALGEFSEASNALDVLVNVKRHIRLLVFSPSHGH
jgi:tetratricopeptide (TPR) repeat protein